jgi:hypothetical protein
MFYEWKTGDSCKRLRIKAEGKSVYKNMFIVDYALM